MSESVFKFVFEDATEQSAKPSAPSPSLPSSEPQTSPRPQSPPVQRVPVATESAPPVRSDPSRQILRDVLMQSAQRLPVVGELAKLFDRLGQSLERISSERSATRSMQPVVQPPAPVVPATGKPPASSPVTPANAPPISGPVSQPSPPLVQPPPVQSSPSTKPAVAPSQPSETPQPPPPKPVQQPVESNAGPLKQPAPVQTPQPMPLRVVTPNPPAPAAEPRPMPPVANWQAVGTPINRQPPPPPVAPPPAAGKAPIPQPVVVSGPAPTPAAPPTPPPVVASAAPAAGAAPLPVVAGQATGATAGASAGGGVAALGAVAAGAAVVAGVLLVAAKAAKAFGDQLDRTTEKLAPFSAAISAQQAQNDVRKMVSEMNALRMQAGGKSYEELLTKFSEQRTDASVAIQKMQDTLSSQLLNHFQPLIQNGVDLLTVTVGGVQAIATAVDKALPDWLQRLLGPLGMLNMQFDGLHATAEKIRARWESEDLNAAGPMFQLFGMLPDLELTDQAVQGANIERKGIAFDFLGGEELT